MKRFKRFWQQLRAFRLGLKEAGQCAFRGMGRTWDDPDCSEAYDRGVNLGVNFFWVVTIIRHPLREHELTWEEGSKPDGESS